jgi:hypothetical protein
MNLLKDIGNGALQVLKTVAPTIAATALGPFAPLAAPILQRIFGTTDAKSTEAALLTATPEQILALKQADIAHSEFLTNAGITEDKLAFDDLANARAREVAVKDTTPRNLAYLIIGFTGISIAATLAGWTKVDSALSGTLIGYLVAECRSTLTYYFGSSAGSQAKDATLADIAKQP